MMESRSRRARYAAGRFSIWNCRLCVPLPACSVPKFRSSVPPPPTNAAAAWSKTVKVAVVVCERLEELGSLAVKHDRVYAKIVRGSHDRIPPSLTRAGGDAACAGRRKRGAAALDCRGERIIQDIRPGDGKGKDSAVVATAAIGRGAVQRRTRGRVADRRANRSRSTAYDDRVESPRQQNRSSRVGGQAARRFISRVRGPPTPVKETRLRYPVPSVPTQKTVP